MFGLKEHNFNSNQIRPGIMSFNDTTLGKPPHIQRPELLKTSSTLY